MKMIDKCASRTELQFRLSSSECTSIHLYLHRYSLHTFTLQLNIIALCKKRYLLVTRRSSLPVPYYRSKRNTTVFGSMRVSSVRHRIYANDKHTHNMSNTRRIYWST
jgi:hypothetical protein